MVNSCFTKAADAAMAQAPCALIKASSSSETQTCGSEKFAAAIFSCRPISSNTGNTPTWPSISQTVEERASHLKYLRVNGLLFEAVYLQTKSYWIYSKWEGLNRVLRFFWRHLIFSRRVHENLKSKVVFESLRLVLSACLQTLRLWRLLSRYESTGFRNLPIWFHRIKSH